MSRKKKTYVSHRFEDGDKARSTKSFFKEKGGPIKSEPVFVKDKNAKSAKDIDKTIRKEMKGADNVLVVNGNNSHSSKWQNREVQLAKSMNKKRAITKVPGSKGGLSQELRKDKKAKKTKWKPRDIEKALK